MPYCDAVNAWSHAQTDGLLERIEEIEKVVMKNNAMLEAIMSHFGVPDVEGDA